MAEDKGKTDQVHRSMVSVQVVSHLYGVCASRKKLNYKQRIAVAKAVKLEVNPKATPTDVRRALHHLSPSGKITAEHLRSVRSISTLL